MENLYVGRLVGETPKDFITLLHASDRTTSSSNNVIKLENLQRNGELTPYQNSSEDNNYTVVTEVDGTTLDFEGDCPWWNPFCTDSNDPADWTTLKKLFSTSTYVSDFDVFRGMTHGNTTGISSSSTPAPSHTYMTAANVSLSKTSIASHFDDFYPFFIFDACLVGQTESNSSSSLMNQLAKVNTRGLFAATHVTWTPHISDFIDIFYVDLMKRSIGASINGANTSFDFDNYSAEMESFTKFQMNYYGVPWAQITPPDDKDKTDTVPIFLQDANKGLTSYAVTGTKATGQFSKQIAYTTAGYTWETSDGYDLIVIDGYDLTWIDENTPVLPVKKFFVELPAGATVDDVTANFTGQTDFSAKNIPAYDSPDPMTGGGSYVACPNVGAWPADKLTYSVSQTDSTTRVMVEFVPAVFNTADQTGSIWDNVAITITYSTPYKGAVQGSSLDKSQARPGESFTASATVENTTDSSQMFYGTCTIKDQSGSVLDTQASSVSIAAGAVGTLNTPLSAPSDSGYYTVELVVTDASSSVIWKASFDLEVMTLIPGELTIPDNTRVGELVQYVVPVTNYTDQPVNLTIKLYVVQDRTVIATLPQMETTLDGNTTANIDTFWTISETVAPGSYSVYAVITYGDEEYKSESRDITIRKAKSAGGGINQLYDLLM